MELLLLISELRDSAPAIFIIPEREILFMSEFFPPETRPILPAAIWS